MKKKGRPPKLTKATVDQICLYIENGNTNKDAVLLCGLTESAFYQWKERAMRLKDQGRLGRVENEIYLYLVESLKKAESKFRAYHISNINAASKSQWQASAWMLERRYPGEYGRRGIEIEVPVKPADEAEEVVRIYIPDNGRGE